MDGNNRREHSNPRALPGAQKKSPYLTIWGLYLIRQHSTLPKPCDFSTIDLEGLNFRIRYGNGCSPFSKVTGNLFHFYFHVINPIM